MHLNYDPARGKSCTKGVVEFGASFGINGLLLFMWNTLGQFGVPVASFFASSFVLVYVIGRQTGSFS